MNGELNKNSPKDLGKLFTLVCRSVEHIEDNDLEIWCAWLDAIKKAIKESEDRIKEKI